MKSELVAVLHSIRSVHNTGSIFRTADGAGFTKIYLCGITPAPLDRFSRVRKDFAKVSLGAEKSVVWEKKVSTTTVLKNLQKEGFRIFAIEQAPGSTNIFRASAKSFLHPRTAIVMGNEVQGLPKSILQLTDGILEIPMLGAKESLNVGVAFGIAAYRFAENRHIQ